MSLDFAELLHFDKVPDIPGHALQHHSHPVLVLAGHFCLCATAVWTQTTRPRVALALLT
jgi:hypothetical protein